MITTLGIDFIFAGIRMNIGKRNYSKTEYEGDDYPKRNRSFFRTSFFRNLIKVFGIMLAVSAVLLGILTAYLADYQSCIPENLTDGVTDDFKALVSGNSLDASKAASELIGECTGLEGNLTRSDGFTGYFSGMYDGASVTCVNDSLPGDVNLTYDIYGARTVSKSEDDEESQNDPTTYAGENASEDASEDASENVSEDASEDVSENIKLGELVLMPLDEKSLFHNTRYKIGSLSIDSLHIYRITAPSDVTVYADGAQLKAEISGDDKTDSNDGDNDNDDGDNDSDGSDNDNDSDEKKDITQNGHFTAAGLPDTTMSTYVVGDKSHPTYIESVSADGCSAVKTDDDTWDLSYEVTDSEENDISSFANGFMHSYSEFATKKNATSAKVKAMIYPGADILNAISLYDNSWGQTYSSSDYTDEKVADICRYAVNEYSCRASCTYTIRNGSSGKDYDFAFILYLTDINGEWKVTDMETAK